MLIMQPKTSGRQRRRSAAGTAPQRGMALIEVLVSLLLFSFGLLGLIGLEVRSVNFSVDSEDRNRAAVFANEIASWMWTNGTVAVPAAQLTTWQGQVANATAAGLANGTVTITTTAGTTNSADILISWKPPSDSAATASSTLSTRVILPP
jgi:type IV pilus assembly protein PilV